MTLTERIAVLQRVADAIDAVRAALLPLPDADRRAVLADVLAELERPSVNEPPVVQPPPPGKPVPRPTREPTGGEGATGVSGETRRKLLALLAANPDGLKVTELSERAGVGDNIVSYNLKHEWFQKSDPSYVRSPWVLSEAGKVAAVGLSRSAT